MSSAICFNFDQSKILSSGNGLKFVRRAKNTLSNANSKNFILFPEYLPSLKTLQEKEKMLVIHIFAFSKMFLKPIIQKG